MLARLHNRPAESLRCAERSRGGGLGGPRGPETAGAALPAHLPAGASARGGGRGARGPGCGAVRHAPRLAVSGSVIPWVSASCPLLPTTSAAVTRDKAAPGRGRASGSCWSQRRRARPQLRLIRPTSNQTPGNRKPLSGLLSSPPPMTPHPSRSPMHSTSRAPTLPAASYPLFSTRSAREGMKTLWRPSSGACPQESRPQRGGFPRGHIRGGGLLGVRTGKGADSEARGDWAATTRNWPRSRLGREYWKRDSAYERTESPTPAEKMSGSP